MPDGSLSLTIILSDLETWNAGAHVCTVWLSAHKCLGIVLTPTSFNRGGGVTSLAGEIYVLRPKERDEVEVYDVITSNDQIWHSNSYREQARRTWSRNFSKRPRFFRVQHTPTRYDIWTSTFCKMKFEVTFYRVHRAPDTLSRLGGGQNIVIILRMFILLAAINHLVNLQRCLTFVYQCFPCTDSILWAPLNIIRVPQFCGESPVFRCLRNKLGAPWKILCRRKDTSIGI